MGFKQCQRNRQRFLEKRRLIDQRKRQPLAEACMAGDQNSCRELQQLTTSEEYRALNRFRSEHTSGLSK